MPVLAYCSELEYDAFVDGFNCLTDEELHELMYTPAHGALDQYEDAQWREYNEQAILKEIAVELAVEQAALEEARAFLEKDDLEALEEARVLLEHENDYAQYQTQTPGS